MSSTRGLTLVSKRSLGALLSRDALSRTEPSPEALQVVLSTRPQLDDLPEAQELGVVMGNACRTRMIVFDVFTELKGLMGGSLDLYAQMFEQTREDALVSVAEEAADRGADAIVNLRIETSTFGRNVAEVLVYGTAVRFPMTSDAEEDM